MNTALAETSAPTEAGAARRTVSVARGSIYLAREICDTYFPVIQSVALIVRDDRLLIVPLIQESAGGLILKIRNSRGDRVIQAQEFFRDKGFVEDFEEQTVAVHWSGESAALVVAGLRRVKPQVQT